MPLHKTETSAFLSTVLKQTEIKIASINDYDHKRPEIVTLEDSLFKKIRKKKGKKAIPCLLCALSSAKLRQKIRRLFDHTRRHFCLNWPLLQNKCLDNVLTD